MHVITKSRLIAFWSKYPDSETSLRLWYKRTSLAKWQSHTDLLEVFPSADQVRNLTVFNIGGSRYRLVALIDYTYQKVFIRYVLTHAEYDKDDWKSGEWYT